MKLRLRSGDWAVTALLLSLIIFAIAVGPVLVIWSLNTLFPVLTIPFTFYTWLATAILLVLLVPGVRSSDR